MDVENRKLFKWRIAFFLFGLFLISIGVNITIASNFGVGGWDAANIGMVMNFGFSIGFWLNVWAIVYLLISSLLIKERIKLECLVTSIFLGFCIDMWNILFSQLVIETLPLQFITFLIGITTTSLGAGIYLVSNLPANPIDHLMMVITKRFPKVSIATSKYVVEGVGMLLGLLLGGPVGLGTILMILIFGPIIQFFYKKAENVFHRITAQPL